VALGVLAQHLGDHRRAVAYFSKQLDSVSQGWPGWLRAAAATAILIQEAHKCTLGQHIHFWSLVPVCCTVIFCPYALPGTPESPAAVVEFCCIPSASMRFCSSLCSSGHSGISCCPEEH
uniref:Uncharacterized protein n=1 Tax=Malurus cyaneus samueli TaxID=2593467 RepID=A0A8C5TF80_9PASS